MSFFARLLGIARATPPTTLERGTRALRGGELDAAWAAFGAALEAAADDRGRAVARNKRALVLLARGDRAAAAEEINAALALDPACVAALVNAGNLELEDGRIDAAVARFEAAIALDPDYPEAHHNFGVALRRLGRRREAVRELRRATVLELRRRW